jgi:hypothetical protein
MLKRLKKNRKGTAEVIGTIMFVMILLFFFTNVYLWHDAVSKQVDDMYVQKINTPIAIFLTDDHSQLNVTNKGGSDAALTMLWVDVKSTSGSGPDQTHSNYVISDKVPAGSSILIPSNYVEGEAMFKVVTTLGNSATCTYSPI